MLLIVMSVLLALGGCATAPPDSKPTDSAGGPETDSSSIVHDTDCWTDDGLIDSGADVYDPRHATVPGTSTGIVSPTDGKWNLGWALCVQDTPLGASVVNLSYGTVDTLLVYPYVSGAFVDGSTPSHALSADADDDAWTFVSCAGDRDGDGYEEVAVGSVIQTEARHPIFFSILNGTFDGVEYIDDGETAISTPFPGALSASTLTSSDLDGDGRPEALLTIGGYTPEDDYFWMNGGVGPDQRGVLEITDLDLQLSPPPSTPDDSYSTVDVGDVNGDGYSDLGGQHHDRSDNEGDTFDILLGPLTGGHDWGEAVITLQAASGTGWANMGTVVAPGPFDVDGDGADDLVLSVHREDDGWSLSYPEAAIFTKLAPGRYTVDDSTNRIPLTTDCYEEYGDLESFRVADFNGDGIDDIMVTFNEREADWFPSGALLGWLGPLNDVGARPTHFIGNAQPDSWLWGDIATEDDLDGDGAADVVLGSNAFSDTPGVEDGDGAIFIYESSITPLQPWPG